MRQCSLLWPPRQAIIFLPCGFFLLSIYLPFFYSTPNLSGQIRCLPYFYTWRGLSANLECRSERSYSRLAANTGRKKVAKTRHLGTIALFFFGLLYQFYSQVIGLNTTHKLRCLSSTEIIVNKMCFNV